MKYVILCLALLCCFAIAGADRSTEAPSNVCDSSQALADPVDDDGIVAAGGSCGGNTCGKGKYCCNASCGICVPVGMSCTQQAC